MTVYIIFGDELRADGYNIESIWLNYEEAKAEVDRLNAVRNVYHIEDFETD